MTLARPEPTSSTPPYHASTATILLRQPSILRLPWTTSNGLRYEPVRSTSLHGAVRIANVHHETLVNPLA